jgi:transposase-like protein
LRGEILKYRQGGGVATLFCILYLDDALWTPRFHAASSLTTSQRWTRSSQSSINNQLRKVTKNCGHYPNDDAAIKLLYLALRKIDPNAELPAQPCAATIAELQAQLYRFQRIYTSFEPTGR